MKKSLACPLVAISLLGLAQNDASAEVEFNAKGLIQASVIHNDYKKPWLNPWLDGGVGVTRHDQDTSQTIDQALLDLDLSIYDSLSIKAAATYNYDGESGFGFTELYGQYQPLTQGLRHTFKAGMFYPSFSYENPDIGWSSPYSNSFSAINSWIAEELRPIGVEWHIRRPGSRFKSPHSFGITVSAYQNNDGLGSLLAWRGWALHNRQSTFHEKIHFADYFQFMPVENPNPTYVDISDETDGRIGYYVGGDWQYNRQTEAKLFYYDNLADPFSIETDMQYGWRTRFWSFAAQHKFNRDFRLLGQVMIGDTEMGNLEKGVFNEFMSWYLLGSYRFDDHRFSVRYDNFEVTDIDENQFDPNDSNGHSWSFNWRYIYSQNFRLGFEALFVTSDNKNRTLWKGWESKHEQTQLALSVQYRFRK